MVRACVQLYTYCDYIDRVYYFDRYVDDRELHIGQKGMIAIEELVSTSRTANGEIRIATNRKPLMLRTKHTHALNVWMQIITAVCKDSKSAASSEA